MCIVLTMSLCPFLSVSASDLGQPYSQPYMPVCPYYVTAENLPFGEDTLCVYVEETTQYADWFFMSMASWSETYKATIDNGTQYNMYDEYSGFFADENHGSQNYYRFCFYSLEQIIKVRYNLNTNTYTVSTIGERDTNFPLRFKALPTFLSSYRKIICSRSYYYNGHGIDYYGYTDLLPYYIAQYPDSVKTAIDSIGTNQSMLTNYYNALDSSLDTLNHNVAVMSNNVDELQSQVSELQSQLSSQSGEYQSALSNAQSEIESNAQSAAQSAADDVVNAGEDVSDIDDDMSDVNDIVDTLDGWIEDLDAFADTIDDTADEVADALDYADDFLSGFLSACPAIVIALFSFALVFLIVRKIIGR